MNQKQYIEYEHLEPEFDPEMNCPDCGAIGYMMKVETDEGDIWRCECGGEVCLS